MAKKCLSSSSKTNWLNEGMGDVATQQQQFIQGMTRGTDDKGGDVTASPGSDVMATTNSVCDGKAHNHHNNASRQCDDDPFLV